jgi:type III secretion protein J
MRSDERYRGRGVIRGVFAFALMGVLAGCGVPVATGLEDSDANRIVVALDRAGVAATKEVDPQTEGKTRVIVANDEAARAIEAMQGEGLPRPKPAGVLDTLDKGALVPSRAAEHAQLVAGMAGDLERSLEAIDGVLAARVHLNIPSPEPLRDVAPMKATASVLIEHRGATPPIAQGDVQRLVAGGVAGLAREDVAVVTVPRTSASVVGASMAHVGPISVARESVRALQVALVGLVLLVLALAAATLALYTRLARLRADAAPPSKPLTRT